MTRSSKARSLSNPGTSLCHWPPLSSRDWTWLFQTLLRSSELALIRSALRPSSKWSHSLWASSFFMKRKWLWKATLMHLAKTKVETATFQDTCQGLYSSNFSSLSLVFWTKELVCLKPRWHSRRSRLLWDSSKWHLLPSSKPLTCLLKKRCTKKWTIAVWSTCCSSLQACRRTRWTTWWCGWTESKMVSSRSQRFRLPCSDHSALNL